MVGGKSGMGLQKHRKSGVAPKSPKARHQALLEANRQEKKQKKYEMFESVEKLMRS